MRIQLCLALSVFWLLALASNVSVRAQDAPLDLSGKACNASEHAEGYLCNNGVLEKMRSCDYSTDDPRWHPCDPQWQQVNDPTQEDLTRDSIERGTPRDDSQCEDVERNLETARELYSEYKNKYPEHLETAQHELNSSLAEEKAWHCKD